LDITRIFSKLIIQSILDNQIDGQGLLALKDDVITEILFIHDKNKEQNNANIQRFKDKLQEWKMKHTEDRNRRGNE
jgi:tRNA(Phe) wybutosine-synthesizing methylase Tyw3